MTDIELVSTSFQPTEVQLSNAKSVIASLDHTACTYSRKKLYLRKWAGNPEQRLNELDSASRSSAKIVWNIIGGSGIIQFLPFFRFRHVRKKLYVGSSDFCMFTNALADKRNIVSINAKNSGLKMSSSYLEVLKQFLAKKPVKSSFRVLQHSSKKSVSGFIRGGSLISLTWSLGSKYEVNCLDKIVCFDKLGKGFLSTYNNLVQLKNSSLFRPKALVFMQVPRKDRKKLLHALTFLFPDIPIVYSVQSGKLTSNVPFYVGGRAVLDFNQRILTQHYL